MSTFVEYRCQISGPTAGLPVEPVTPLRIHYLGTLGEAESCELDLPLETNIYATELAVTDHPVQLRAKVDLFVRTDPATSWTSVTEPEWQGVIFQKGIRTGPDFGVSVHVVALSKMHVLHACLALIDPTGGTSGDPLGAVEGPTKAIALSGADAANSLIRIQGAAGGTALPSYAWFPPKASGAYELTSTTNVSTTLNANINSAVTSIEGSTTHGGFEASGLISITTAGTEELIHYDGYDNDGGGGRYQFKNCVRGVLGTTAAAHLATETVWQLRPMKMAPRWGMFLEKLQDGTLGTDWIPLSENEYEPAVDDGYFEQFMDVLTAVGTTGPHSRMRATYRVYDSEHADALTVSDRIRYLMDTSRDVGGPGWGSNDYDLDALLDLVVIPRHTLREPRSVYDAIQELLSEAGLSTGDGRAADAVSMVDRHSDGELLIGFVTQKADAVAADKYISGTVEWTHDLALDDLYTAVEVFYTPVVGNRLAVPERVWHPAVGAAIGTGTVRSIFKQEQEEHSTQGVTGKGAWDDTGNEFTGAGTNKWVDKLFDNLVQSGWALASTNGNDLGTSADALVGWNVLTGTTPATVVCEAARVVLDARLTNQATGPTHFQLLGITSGLTVTGGVPSYTAANAVALGIEKAWSNTYPIVAAAWGNLQPFGEVEIANDNIDLPIQGFVARWRGAPTRDIGGQCRFMALKHLEVLGRPKQSVLVQISATPNGNAANLYVQSSTYNRLRSTETGEPRVLKVDVGRASRQKAIAYGRILLAQSLALIGDITVTSTDVLDAMPLCGRDTIEVIDAQQWTSREAFTTVPLRGIALHRDILWDSRGRVAKFIIRDYRAPVPT